jgi:hypothetical protein
MNSSISEAVISSAAKKTYSLSSGTFKESTMTLASGETMTELSYQLETLLPLASCDHSGAVRQAAILSQSNSHRGEATDLLGVSVEIYRMFDNSVRPARVVLVNDRGEIVLDTMIRVEDSMMVMVKPGKKTAILEDAKARGPAPDLVRRKVLELIAGKKLVGYGLKAKL